MAGSQEVVTLVARARDEASAPLASASRGMANFSAAAELATAKVGRAASRLSGEIQQLGLMVGGQAGEITNSIGQIGQVGAGLAISGQAVKSLGTAFGEAAGSAGAFGAAVAALPALLAAAGFVVFTSNLASEKTTMDSLTNSGAILSRQLQILEQDHNSGAISDAQYTSEVAKLRSQMGALAPVIAGATEEQRESAKAAGTATMAYLASERAIVKTLGTMNGWPISAGNAGAALTLLTRATNTNAAAAEAAVISLIDQARGLDAVAIAAQRAAAALAGYKVAHPMNLRKPGTADSDIRFSSTGGVGDQFSVDQAAQNFQTSWDLAHPTATHRGGGSGGIAKAADDALAEVKRAISGARSAGDTYYDNVHDQQLKAARDAHDRASKEIAEARRSSQAQLAGTKQLISDTLAERRRLNAEPVTAAEAAQAAVEHGQQMRNLEEARQAAVLGGDEKAIRDANEALTNAQAQENIDNLRRQQAENDRAAEAMAAAQLQAAEEADTKRQTELDAQQRDADTAAAQREQAADDLWVANRKKFDEHILALDESKKATLRLAQLEELRLLSDELQRAKAGGTPREVIAAQNAYDEARKSAGHHAAGGWAGLRGPELSWLGESGPEYVVRNQDLRSGGIQIHPGAIVIQGGSKSPREIAAETILAFKREANRQGFSMSRSSTF